MSFIFLSLVTERGMQFESWMEDEGQLQRREVFTWTWIKYESVPHIKLCNASEHLKYSAWKRYCVFYNVFVAFVGLNNNTIVAMQNIEFGSFSSDWYWSSRKCQYRSDTDPEYRLKSALSLTRIKFRFSLCSEIKACRSGVFTFSVLVQWFSQQVICDGDEWPVTICYHHGPVHITQNSQCCIHLLTAQTVLYQITWA